MIPKEDQITRLLNFSDILTRELAYTSKFTKLCFRPKSHNNQEFGYYPTPAKSVESIVHVINKYKVTSLLDLGCGIGALCAEIKCLTGITVGGFDNETKLIETARRFNISDAHSFIEKDILTIVPRDICHYDCVYFWRPFTDDAVLANFMLNLHKCLRVGQIVISKGRWLNPNKSIYKRYEKLKGMYEYDCITVHRKI